MERISRRDILKRAAALGLSSSAIGALLAACGGAAATATSAPSAKPSTAASAAPAASAAASAAPSTAASAAPAASAAASSAPASSAAASTAPAASAAASTAASSAPAAGGGGKLVIGTDLNDVLTFDPGTHYEIYSSSVMGAIYEGLVTQNPPDLTKFVPILAKEVPTKENGGVSADGKVYTFKLRENVKFHSGNTMTADDVVFSSRRLSYLQRNPSFLADPYVGADKKVNVEAVDPLTVKFTLTDPNVAFLSYMSTVNNVVLDSKVVKTKGGLDTPDAKDNDKAKDWLDQHSEGTGPYKLTAFKSKEEVDVEKHTAYWRTPAVYDQIVLRQIKDSGTELQQLKAGTIDLAQTLDSDAIDSLRKDTNYTIFEGNSLNHVYLALQTDPKIGDVMSDKRVRQAVGWSVDYDGIIKGLKKGAAVQPATIVPLGLLSADKAQSLAYKTDVNKAKDLVTQAGAAGKTIKLTYSAGIPYEGVSSETLAAKLKADIERSGLKIELTPVESQQRLADYRAGNLQFTFSSWAPDYADVHTYAEPFGLSTGVAAKRVHYNNPQVDALLKQGLTESDPAKRSDIYLQIQKTLVDEAPFLMLFQPTFQIAAKKSVTNVIIHPVILIDLYQLKKG
jgi:peptide/nickel transport system substrate-binding protein